MKLLDKIVLNRLIAILTGFVLALLKMFVPQNTEEETDPEPKPLRKRIIDKLRKKKTDE